MTGKIHDFITKHFVADVPDALSACLDCGFVQCSNEKWESCPNRLAREAGLRAMRAIVPATPAASAANPESDVSPNYPSPDPTPA
nr:hypothetical protein [uncultured Rhodopila sp.]